MSRTDIELETIRPRSGVHEALLKRLVKIGDDLIEGRPISYPLAPVIAELAAIEPERVLIASSTIATASFYRYFPYGLRPRETRLTLFAYLKNKVLRQAKPTPMAQLQAVKGLEYLFWFHYDGYLREVALEKCDAGFRERSGLPLWLRGLTIGFPRFVKRRKNARKESFRKLAEV